MVLSVLGFRANYSMRFHSGREANNSGAYDADLVFGAWAETTVPTRQPGAGSSFGSVILSRKRASISGHNSPASSGFAARRSPILFRNSLAYDSCIRTVRPTLARLVRRDLATPARETMAFALRQRRGSLVSAKSMTLPKSNLFFGKPTEKLTAGWDAGGWE